jgi:hypothetical protein
MSPLISWQVALGQVQELRRAERRSASVRFWRSSRRHR